MGKTDVSEMIRTSNARDFGLSEMLEYFEQVLRISEIEELVERETDIAIENDGRSNKTIKRKADKKRGDDQMPLKLMYITN